MRIPTIETLFEDQLKDLYSAEGQLVKALPKLAKTASTPELRVALENHLKETQEQVKRLERIGEMLGKKLTGKKCKAMEGLIEEGKEVFEMEAPGTIIDAAMIAAAQRVEHYEISGYGTARALAEHLGHQEIATLLSDTLDEESQADEKLTDICQDHVLPAIETDEEREGSDMIGGMDTGDEDEEVSVGRSSSR